MDRHGIYSDEVFRGELCVLDFRKTAEPNHK